MKKICYWMVLFFIALIFGCARTEIIKADLPKTFPNVQILNEKLDRKEALKILNKFNGNCMHANYDSNANSAEWKGDGVHYIVKVIVATKSEQIDAHKIRTTNTIQIRPMVLYFEDIQRLSVEKGIAPKQGSCSGLSSAYLIFIRSQKGAVRLNVYSEEERDQAIAALLTLCPNIK